MKHLDNQAVRRVWYHSLVQMLQRQYGSFMITGIFIQKRGIAFLIPDHTSSTSCTRYHMHDNAISGTPVVYTGNDHEVFVREDLEGEVQRI